MEIEIITHKDSKTEGNSLIYTNYKLFNFIYLQVVFCEGLRRRMFTYLGWAESGATVPFCTSN